MAEVLVIARVVGGHGDERAVMSVAHLPATEILGDVPERAVSVCGVSGFVYAHAGLLEGTPVCEKCSAPPPPVVKVDRKVRVYEFGRRTWTRGEIVAAIVRWDAAFGRPPSQTGWRRRGEWWPSAAHVATVFGSWPAALEAAGFVALPVGRPRVWFPHGTERRYFQGCRLECCRVAHRVAQRERAESRRAA